MQEAKIVSAPYLALNPKMTKPYSKLAPFYKSVMEHVDYAKWGRYLERLVRLHCKFPKTLLEVGAGAGLLSRHFAPKSLQSRVSTDISEEMIALADPEFAGLRAVVDAAKLPFTGKFDMVLMTYDAVNYLSKDKLLAFFKEVARVLSEGGIFVFDAVTEFNSECYFDDVWDVTELENCVINRHSVYDYRKHLQKNEFDFFCKGEDGKYERFSETHEQFIYAQEFFEKTLKRAGLKLEAVYSEFSLAPVNPETTRMQFVVTL